MHTQPKHAVRASTLLSAVACACVVASVGCTKQKAAASETDRATTLPDPSGAWRLTATPLDIGIADGDPHYLLHNAVSSLLLDDGRIVVLNAGSQELRFYDTGGKFLNSAGRKGSGPGEFRWPQRIYLAHPDTILVFDAGTQRESLFDTQGRFVRDQPWVPADSEPFPRDAWLYRHTLVDGPPSPDARESVRRLLNALPPLESPRQFRFARVDTQDRVWVRAAPWDPQQSTGWSVYAKSGAPLARVTTPPGFEPEHIGRDFLLGRSYDSVNVEHVRLYRLSGLPAKEPPAPALMAQSSAPAHPAAVPDALRRNMLSVVRNTMAQQEIYYSLPEHGYSYAARADQLEWPEDMDGLVPNIIDGGPTGWTMVLFHEREPIACAVTAGIAGPVGWRPGIATCVAW